MRMDKSSLKKILDRIIFDKIQAFTYKVAGVSVASIYDIDKLAKCFDVKDKELFKSIVERTPLTLPKIETDKKLKTILNSIINDENGKISKADETALKYYLAVITLIAVCKRAYLDGAENISAICKPEGLHLINEEKFKCIASALKKDIKNVVKRIHNAQAKIVKAVKLIMGAGGIAFYTLLLLSSVLLLGLFYKKLGVISSLREIFMINKWEQYFDKLLSVMKRYSIPKRIVIGITIFLLHVMIYVAPIGIILSAIKLFKKYEDPIVKAIEENPLLR